MVFLAKLTADYAVWPDFSFQKESSSVSALILTAQEFAATKQWTTEKHIKFPHGVGKGDQIL